MTLPDQETGDLPDDVLESVITRAGKSSSFAFERELASHADCPTEFELRELARGAIDTGTPQTAKRRAALARHLVTCPKCFERNLSVLAAESSVADPTVTNERLGHPLRLVPRAFVAAAALLLCAMLLRDGIGPEVASPVTSVRGTDAFGFEDRNGETKDDVELRRTVVETRVGGFLALAVLDGTSARLEPVEGDHRSISVAAGEEVLLPLDRALPCAKGAVWLVIHSSQAIDESQLSSALPDLARGYPVAGFTATRVSPRNR